MEVHSRVCVRKRTDAALRSARSFNRYVLIADARETPAEEEASGCAVTSGERLELSLDYAGGPLPLHGRPRRLKGSAEVAVYCCAAKNCKPRVPPRLSDCGR